MPKPETFAVAKRSSPATTKAIVNPRIDAACQLIDDAATAFGTARTDHLVESSRRHATDVPLDQHLFRLDPDPAAAFLRALDNLPAPGPKLRALLRRVPAWQT